MLRQQMNTKYMAKWTQENYIFPHTPHKQSGAKISLTKDESEIRNSNGQPADSFRSSIVMLLCESEYIFFNL